MIAQATNPARYPLTVRCLPAFAAALTCSVIGVGAATATGSAEDSCRDTACEVATAAAAGEITASGVGAVKLGRTYASLRRANRLGKVRPGCELAGPRTRSAPLRAPLVGSVDLTLGTPRRVAAITVRGGATARGVGIGASAGAIRKAFPRARFDRSHEDVFGLTFVRVPRGAGGRLEFGVDTTTKKVALIGVPRIPLCD